MKKFIAFAAIILSFTLLCIFMTEKTDVLGLDNIPFQYTFKEADDQMTLSWKPLPYPCFYRVETLSKTTGRLPDESEYHLVKSDFTFRNSCKVPPASIPTYYQVTAYGMFGRVAGADKPVRNPDYPEPPHPVTIFKYDTAHPASLMPYLVWHSVPNAVCYEIELLSAPPENENGIELSSQYHIFSTREIYTNGYQADLRPFLKQNGKLYWRVRAMDFHHNPIGVFSQAEPLVIDAARPLPDRPLLNTFDRATDFQQPLYPVYQWIPMHGVLRYEVELMTEPTSKEKENNTQPAARRVWYHTVDNAYSCYDEYPRPDAGEYYWRVRAVDAAGNTIGHYSDTREFTVASHATRIKAAAFGDSITHGGGSLSYSPANMEYSYMTYLDFTALNLGHSGDTSHTTLRRFDQDVLPFQPYNLLIMTGSNSLRDDQISADDIIGDLESIRHKCEKNDIRPIFLTLLPVNPAHIMSAFGTETDPDWLEKMQRVNAYIKKQPYHIDLTPYFFDESHTMLDPMLALDGLHPDIEGKKLMAEIINQHKDLLKDALLK
jgi:lysophospholipase L1-like esterase